MFRKFHSLYKGKNMLSNFFSMKSESRGCLYSPSNKAAVFCYNSSNDKALCKNGVSDWRHFGKRFSQICLFRVNLLIFTALINRSHWLQPCRLEKQQIADYSWYNTDHLSIDMLIYKGIQLDFKIHTHPWL